MRLASLRPFSQGSRVTKAASPNPRQVQLVGRKIRELRKRHKLTQTELAARIGIQQSDLSRMEQGQYRVSLDTLFKILAEFEMGIAEFFGELGQRAGTMSSRDARVLQDFKSLDERGQREVEEFIAFKRSKDKEANGNDR